MPLLPIEICFLRFPDHQKEDGKGNSSVKFVLNLAKKKGVPFNMQVKFILQLPIQKAKAPIPA